MTNDLMLGFTIGIGAILSIMCIIQLYIEFSHNKNSKMEYRPKIESLKCTNDLLEFIRLLVYQHTLLRITEFVHSFDKPATSLTEIKIKEIAKLVATDVHDSIDIEKIYSMTDDRCVITHQYINDYIVSMSLHSVRDMIIDNYGHLIKD